MTAFLICNSAAASLRIAALTVLDRLIVAAHRAGCGPITVVCEGELPDVQRSSALGIPFHVEKSMPAVIGGALVAEACVLVDPRDLRLLIASGGLLVTRSGIPLPVGIGDSAACVATHGSPALVTDRLSAREAERSLWASLGNSCDGIVDRWFNRPVGRVASKVLVHTPVTPNQISLLATIIGVVAALCFTRGTFEAGIAGALLLQLSAVIDCVDGDIARVMFKESRIGKWLDLAGDQVVHVALFSSIAMGLAASGLGAVALGLGASAVLGAVISFLVVVRSMRLPAEQRSSRLQKLIDATTNRDFSVVLIVLALAGRVDLFLWLAGIGVHVFWITALIVTSPARHPVATPGETA